MANKSTCSEWAFTENIKTTASEKFAKSIIFALKQLQLLFELVTLGETLANWFSSVCVIFAFFLLNERSNRSFIVVSCLKKQIFFFSSIAMDGIRFVSMGDIFIRINSTKEINAINDLPKTTSIHLLCFSFWLTLLSATATITFFRWALNFWKPWQCWIYALYMCVCVCACHTIILAY